MHEVRVTRALRPERPELTCRDLQAAIDYVRDNWAPGTEQYAIWICEPPPSGGPDCIVCVPFRVFEDWEALAAEVVAAWEDKWLLIESMPARHRDAARDGLRRVIADTLLVAAVSGIDDRPREPDVGF